MKVGEGEKATLGTFCTPYQQPRMEQRKALPSPPEPYPGGGAALPFLHRRFEDTESLTRPCPCQQNTVTQAPPSGLIHSCTMQCDKNTNRMCALLSTELVNYAQLVLKYMLLVVSKT